MRPFWLKVVSVQAGCNGVQPFSLEVVCDVLSLCFLGQSSDPVSGASGLIAVGQRLAALSKARTSLSLGEMFVFLFLLCGRFRSTMSQSRRSARLAGLSHAEPDIPASDDDFLTW